MQTPQRKTESAAGSVRAALLLSSLSLLHNSNLVLPRFCYVYDAFPPPVCRLVTVFLRGVTLPFTPYYPPKSFVPQILARKTMARPSATATATAPGAPYAFGATKVRELSGHRSTVRTRHLHTALWLVSALG